MGNKTPNSLRALVYSTNRNAPEPTEESETTENGAATALVAPINEPAIAGPKTAMHLRKKKHIVSTLTSLEEAPEEDAVADSTEGLDSIVPQVAAAAVVAPAPDEVPEVVRSQSFSTSQNENLEPAAECRPRLLCVIFNFLSLNVYFDVIG